jgi:hypothetical protein
MPGRGERERVDFRGEVDIIGTGLHAG